MSLSHGRRHLAIPGPSVMPDRVLRSMHRPAPNIYEGELVDMVPGIVADLKRVARTKGDVAIYIANGHGAWEAALANTHSRGDRILVLATGRFAHGWAGMAEAMGLGCDILDFGKSSDVDMPRVAEALAEDSAHAYKSVLLVHVDTSSSVRNNVAAVRRTLSEAGHPALLMVDCIASLACDRFEMDKWGVDLMVAASQKGLMTPPGVAFVYFNGKADSARENADCVTSYWDWRPRTRPEEFYQYFGGTAPTHHLYGLREALDMIKEEGIEAVWARHDLLARAIWSAFEAWGRKGPMQLNIADPAKRSVAVTAARIGAPHGAALREWVDGKAGLTLGIGLGMSEPDDPAGHGFFRVAHMGHVNAHMVLGTLAAIQAGLGALGLPHGPGALDAAAEICAEA